jgi:adenylate cyclase
MKRFLNSEQTKRLGKLSKKFVKYSSSPFTIGLLITFATTAISVRYYDNQLFIIANKDDRSLPAMISQLHQRSIDWRLTDRGPAPGSDRIAILAVDEKAVQQEGRWPWPRDRQARVIERALNFGAKSVSFDIVYSEPDETSAIPALHRLKHNLIMKPGLNPEVLPMIDNELAQVDGDQTFANTLKTHADRMILGSFFDSQNALIPGRQDFCYDAIFRRSKVANYWKRESLPLMVIDDSNNRLGFPDVFKSKISDYLFYRENEASKAWFEEHKTVASKVKGQLEDLESVVAPELYPAIATLWINDDVEQTQSILEQVKPELASETGVRLLFSRFAAGFTKQEVASLVDSIQSQGNDYCHTFFTSKDELLNVDAFKKFWGNEEPTLALFNDFSWDKSWKGTLDTRQPANAKETLEQFIARLNANSPRLGLSNAEHWVINIPKIAALTKHSGYFNAAVDTDGTIRRSYLLVRSGDSYMPSIALKQFLIDQNYSTLVTVDANDTKDFENSRKVVKSFEILDNEKKTVMRIPVAHDGSLLINYAGAEKMFPHVSMADILTDTPKMFVKLKQKVPASGRWEDLDVEVDKKEFLKDKLLIAGATATGIYDLRLTPFQENFPGVETHANVLSNLLIENARTSGTGRAPASAPGFLRAHPGEQRAMWVILVVLGITMAALLTYFGSIAGLGITICALGGVYATDKYFFFNNGIVTTVIFPIFEIFGSFISLTFYKYFTEERKKRELKGTFEKYVSPAIVAEVMSDPENIELGGKKMELTVMFSDVRGFTTISEKLDPRQLSDLLNSYLTPMTDLVFKNKGTLDKYMGDAIMAFWGAPIHFPDHAKHAARCALQMIERLKVLQDEYRAKGLPNIDIGIGLNTGDMSVGNMGSETVRSYTVMGDSVNLGSRLEGINKEYGTRIITSEFTNKEIADTFVTREVDWVRVKGKAQPVRIFELIAEGAPTPAITELLKHFTLGFQLYHERKFQGAIAAFNETLKINPDDAVSQLYVERCEDYLKEPPDENWDGVCTMTHK